MALNYKKSGDQALVVVHTEAAVSGGFHIIGKQLGVALDGGEIGDLIAVSLSGVWELTCEGDAFTWGTPLHFSVANRAMYAGTPQSQDFENVAIAWSDGGDTLTTCQAKINAHIATVVPAPPDPPDPDPPELPEE